MKASGVRIVTYASQASISSKHTMAAHVSTGPGPPPFAPNGTVVPGSTGLGPFGAVPDQPARDEDFCFLDDLAAELTGGVYELDDVLLDDLELPLPASADVAASTACASPCCCPLGTALAKSSSFPSCCVLRCLARRRCSHLQARGCSVQVLGLLACCPDDDASWKQHRRSVWVAGRR